MPSTPRTVTAAMLGHIIWSNGGKFIILLIISWGLVLAAFVAEVFGFELRSRFGMGSVLDSRTGAIIATVISCVVVVIALPLVLRALRLARMGEQVLGTIRRKLGVTWRSTETVQISYTYQDGAFTIKAPLGRHADELGTQVQIIADPQRPSRGMLREYVFPPGFDIDA